LKKATTILDPKLETLLLKEPKDEQYILDVFAKYSELGIYVVTGAVKHYKKHIVDAITVSSIDATAKKGLLLLLEGVSSYFLGAYQAAIGPILDAIKYLDETRLTDLVGFASLICGASYRSLGELDVAVRYFLKGLGLINISGSLGYHRFYTYYNLAEINLEIKDFVEAKIYYGLAMDVAKTLKHDVMLYRALNGLANFEMQRKNLDKCKYYLDLSIEIPITSDINLSRYFCDLGTYYKKKGDYQKALESLQKSYDIRISNESKDAATTSLISLAQIHLFQNSPTKALEMLEEALSYSLRYKSKTKILDCYYWLAKTYTKLEDWKNATQSYKYYDQLNEDQKNQQIQNINKFKNARIKEQKLLIEETHREIQESIRYAERIQSAVLPQKREIIEHLPDSFVYYQPKDVVAGDFYWLECLGEEVLFAVADCTGHGVPGAMLSVLCNNALNRSVREFELFNPAHILDKTREIIIEEFNKSQNKVYDGMDIALCWLKGDKLIFSGAYNPLLIIRDNELIEIKADKQPVALYDNMKSFTFQEFELQKGDVLYLFSDGFQDQFGGPKFKKYKKSKFKTFLQEIHQEPMKIQKQLLKSEFIKWKANNDQTDDVCILGFRV